MSPYAHWTAMTDTREMPTVRRGVPVTDQHTEVLHLLDLRPTVPPARRGRWFRASWLAREIAIGAARGVSVGAGVLAFLSLSLLLATAFGGR